MQRRAAAETENLREASEFKGQLGARHRPGKDAEMDWAPAGGAREEGYPVLCMADFLAEGERLLPPSF